MRRLVKRLLLVAVLAGFGILIALAFRPRPVEVQTARVTRGPLEVTIDEDGETRARDRYTLASPVSGQLARIELREGDLVTPSTTITTITPLPIDPRETAELEARVQSAEALELEASKLVARREADCEQARRELERAQSLAKDGIIPRQSLEQAQTAAAAATRELEAAGFREKSAAAEVKRAQAGLISLESQRGRKVQATVVHPPVSGRILRILEKSERVVTAGTPLVVLSNPRNIEAVADVLSTDAVKVRPGAAVWIENWGGAVPLRGKVRLVEPYGYTKVSALGVEEQRVNVVIDFLDSAEGLGDGYKVDVRIAVWQSSEVLKAPVSALFRSGNSWSVFTVERGRAVLHVIEAGHRNAMEAEIVRGLEAGAEVVLHPSSDLREGARVAVVNSGL
ncbi:MAG TPA: efflux RND transporter periplasmic adaptor subunit [Bryobacteraceae bacterium]|nr:efflux RND transporter periplasmic adaptor subunit [Bryobacteraceae bacterium]